MLPLEDRSPPTLPEKILAAVLLACTAFTVSLAFAGGIIWLSGGFDDDNTQPTSCICDTY